MKAYQADIAKFEQSETQVLGISVDSYAANKRFAEDIGVTFPLLSDFKRDVSRRYGTLLEDKFFSNRAYVLIDSTGIVRWSFSEDTPSTRRQNAELLAQLEAHRRSA